MGGQLAEVKEELIEVLRPALEEAGFGVTMNYPRNAKEEAQFEAICVRINNAKAHCRNTFVWLGNLKVKKPKMVRHILLLMFC